MGKKVAVKIMVHTGVWFDTDEVDIRKRRDEDGNVYEERTVITKKYGFRATVKGVDEELALRLEESGLVAIIGEVEDTQAAPAQVAKPAAPPKSGKSGPAPSVDDLTS